jgi:acyl-CoA reductase-like NAD-dependent aldehyde dehydrogenase
VLSQHLDELATVFTREQGRPLKESATEVYWTAAAFEYFADREIPHDVLHRDDGGLIEVRRKPLGVVAAITPWNFPLYLASNKIVPALLVGNTVVLKPSPYTPLATLKLGEILRDVLPPGVLNVVSGGDALGAAMTAHPVPRKVSFTGSVATGKKVAQSAAPDLKHLTLELGGNDPAIVLPDVEPAEIAERLFWHAFENNGQFCMAVKRVYVHESIYPVLVNALADQARRVHVGDGFDPRSQLGPLNNRMQFERVIGLVEDAKQAGGRMVTGGAVRPGPGYFFEPTIVTDISDGTRLVAEEQFGPALPVLPYSDVEEAIERANATHFGLGGSVWTRDVDRGIDIASRLECGTSWVNQHGRLTWDVPFGGAKWSGLSYELGRQGLEAYTRLHVVRVAKPLQRT